MKHPIVIPSRRFGKTAALRRHFDSIEFKNGSIITLTPDSSGPIRGKSLSSHIIDDYQPAPNPSSDRITGREFAFLFIVLILTGACAILTAHLARTL